ncbi:spore coat protein U-like protein [Pseudomonas sp. TE3786]
MKALSWLFAVVVASMLPCASVVADTGLNELNVTKTFFVRAAIARGCLLGSGASDVTTYGNINFGQVASLSADVPVTSTVGAGSIQVQCTPGTSLTIGISTGAHTANVSGGRYLAKGSELLRYQLFQNSGTTIWGDGSNGATAMSLTVPVGAATLTYPVYARLFAVTPMPSAGIYTDTVVVTVSFN